MKILLILRLEKPFIESASFDCPFFLILNVYEELSQVFLFPLRQEEQYGTATPPVFRADQVAKK